MRRYRARHGRRGAQNISERKAVETAREARAVEARQTPAPAAARLSRPDEPRTANAAHGHRMGFAQILQRDKTLTGQQTRGSSLSTSGRHLLCADQRHPRSGAVEHVSSGVSGNEIVCRAAFLHVVCGPTIGSRRKTEPADHYLAPLNLPATVWADEKRLRQVLLALLSNAVKFSDSGQVTLRVTCPPPVVSRGGQQSPPAIRSRRPGHRHERGTIGAAVPALRAGRRGQASRGGTGLDLAINRHLIRLMGGDIEVRSRLGEGSVFSFEISARIAKQHRSGAATTGARRLPGQALQDPGR